MTKILDKYGNPIQYARMEQRTVRKSKSPDPIIARIANSFKDRSRKDIGKWRKALFMAEHPTNPTLQPLMDLYKDLESDGHLKSQMRLIRSSILNTTFHIVDDNTSDIDAETTNLINKKWFYDLISHSINALFYGHSVIQLEEVGDNPRLQLIPRRNVIPQHKKIVPDFTRPLEAIYYDAPEYQNWVIEFGDDEEDFGLLNNIVPNLIWKRNVLQSWAEFCERFGIPMLTATTVRSTPEAINEIEEMLHQLGEAAVGVFPEGTNIDFKEANRTDAYQTFDKMIDRCNSEISKLLVAGVMLSDNGSSRSQSEVHERNLDDRISATDRRNISFFINDVVIPVLTWHGFPFKPTHRFTFDTTQELKLMEHWQIVSQLMNVADVDMEWVSRTFNVPLAEKKKTDLKPIAQSKAFDVVNDDRYTDVEFCQNCYVALNEQQLGDLNRLNGLLIQLFFEEKDTFQAWANITKWEATLLFKGLLEGYGNRLTQAEWNAPDHLMLAMMEQNLYDFTTGKVEARLASMSNLLIDYKEGKLRSYDEFKSEAEKVMGKFNDRYLKTEYNLSVAVGQNSAAFMRAWADKDDFPYVQYITAGDPNVRDSHAVLNHKIFKLDDENARKLLPPNGYGCRCEMISYPHKPHESGVSKGSWGVAQLGEKFKNGNFAVNRADLKQVFLKNQMYANSKEITEKLNNSTFKDWNLKEIKDMTNVSQLVLDKTITPENIKELFKGVKDKNGNEYMPFKDYLNRNLVLTRKNFEYHTSKKYLGDNELRHELFAHVKDILNNPDELWITKSESGLRYRYVKFFNYNNENTAILVDTEIKDFGTQITSWHFLKVEETQKRKGLLVKSNP